MTIEVVTRTIEFILAPAVMVTACATTTNYVLGRYAVISEQLRALGRERLQLVRDEGGHVDPTSIAGIRMRDIDAQIPPLLKRLTLLRASASALGCATIALVLTMVSIAVATMLTVTWAPGFALCIFLLGILLVGGAIVLNTLEIRHSHRTIVRDLAWIEEIRPAGS